MQKSLEIYWDSLGSENPYSGIGTHMEKMRFSLCGLGCQPVYLGSSYGRSSFLKRLPFSKIISPHFASSQLFFHKPKKNKIIFHGFANLNIDFLFKDFLNIKRVLTVHDLIPLVAKGQTSFLSSLQFQLFLRQALKAADAVVCVSSWTKDLIQDLYPEYVFKLHVIENGIDRNHEIHFQAKRAIEEPLRLICVSRFELYKNFDLTLSILRKEKGFVLNFVTNSKGINYLKEKGSDLIKEARLILHSHLNQESLFSLFRQNQVFLTTSRYEGFGLPAFEALSQGLPVVFQKGHALDRVLNKELSFSLPEESSRDLWIKALWEAKKLALTYGFREEVKIFFKNQNSWDTSAKALLDLYESL